MSYSRIDLDSVAPLMPFDKTAAQVAGKGVHFHWEPPANVRHSDLPIQTRRASRADLNDPRYVDFTGVQLGRLTVIGISHDSPSDKRKWVVRCQCGDYEVRRAKPIKKWLAEKWPAGHEPMCNRCGYTRKLKQGIYHPGKAAAAAEAIREEAK